MKVKPSQNFTASGLLDGAGNYVGYTVTVVTAVGAINVRRGSATAQIVDVIPVATAAGATKSLSFPMQMDGGIFVEFSGGATGTVVIHYE